MNPNQALWEKGDFTRIAAAMRGSGAALVDTLGCSGPRRPRPRLRRRDDGAPAARLGAEVVGVDIARNLVDAGNRRAQEAGLSNLRFRQGDATALVEQADQSFDLVVSIFGAMFAPKPRTSRRRWCV